MCQEQRDVKAELTELDGEARDSPEQPVDGEVDGGRKWGRRRWSSAGVLSTKQSRQQVRGSSAKLMELGGDGRDSPERRAGVGDDGGAICSAAGELRSPARGVGGWNSVRARAAREHGEANGGGGAKNGWLPAANRLARTRRRRWGGSGVRR